MKSNFKYRVSVGIALVVLMAGGVSVDAFAQNAAGCFSGPAKMSDADISAFLASPASLLNNSPLGGLPMDSQVRGLAGSSLSSLDPLIGLAGQANPSQMASLGKGLAVVVNSCKTASLDYAQLIQKKVAEANNKALSDAFSAGLTDIQTAALGGGAGAGAGGGGAGGIAGGGAANGASGAAGDQSNSTPTTSESFTAGTRAAFTRNVTQTTAAESNDTSDAGDTTGG